MFWLNLYSIRHCCIYLIEKLLEVLRVFLESDKVCFPLVVNVLYTREAKIDND